MCMCAFACMCGCNGKCYLFAWKYCSSLGHIHSTIARRHSKKMYDVEFHKNENVITWAQNMKWLPHTQFNVYYIEIFTIDHRTQNPHIQKHFFLCSLCQLGAAISSIRNFSTSPSIHACTSNHSIFIGFKHNYVHIKNFCSALSPIKSVKLDIKWVFNENFSRDFNFLRWAWQHLSLLYILNVDSISKYSSYLTFTRTFALKPGNRERSKHQPKTICFQQRHFHFDCRPTMKIDFIISPANCCVTEIDCIKMVERSRKTSTNQTED